MGVYQQRGCTTNDTGELQQVICVRKHIDIRREPVQRTICEDFFGELLRKTLWLWQYNACDAINIDERQQDACLAEHVGEF